MSWSKLNYIVIVGVYSSWKCDSFTLLQRHILNRLYRLISIHTGTNPYQMELVETLVWTLCTEIHIIENYMVKSLLVCIPHPVPTILQWLLGTTTPAVVADGLVLFCAVSSADIMFDGCRYCFRTKLVLSYTTKCNRIECSWVTITTPGWVLMADGLDIFGAMLSATVMITQACTFLGQATSSLQHFFWWLKMTLQCEE